jgi:hypothetical protein
MRLLKQGFVAASLCLLSAGSVAGAKAHGHDHEDGAQCVAYYGPFSSQTVTPCSSPIGLCTHGLLQGEFPATYDFTFTTLQSANDPNDPTKSVYTGTSVVTASDGSGVMYTQDTGIIHIPGNAPAQFVTKAVITHGTKRYHETEGAFIATGSLEFQTGLAVGSFSAVLCKD